MDILTNKTSLNSLNPNITNFGQAQNILEGEKFEVASDQITVRGPYYDITAENELLEMGNKPGKPRALKIHLGCLKHKIPELKKILLEQTDLLFLSFVSVNTYATVPEPKLIELITSTLSKTQNLTGLHFHFENTGLTDKGFKELASVISQIQTLESFSFNIQGWEFSAPGVCALTEAIQGLTNLSHLEMHFRSHQGDIWTESFTTLKTTLKALEKLQFLTLDFHSPAQTTSSEAFALLFEGLSGLTSLKHLNIDIFNSKSLADQTLKIFKDALSSTPSLEYLKLNFAQCPDVTDDGLLHISEALKSLPKLTELLIDLSSCPNITERGFHDIKEAIKSSCAAIKHLDLRFVECDKFSDERVEQLKGSETTVATSIQSLALDFSKSKSFSSKTMKCLTRSIKAFGPSLLNLKLHFQNCEAFNDKSLKYFRDRTKDLKALTHFSLDIGGCKEITADGFAYLCETLQALETLQDLTINLKSTYVSSGILDNLGKGLTVLSSLKVLRLSFDSCDGLKNDGVRNFSKGFKGLTSLQELIINFSSCTDLSGEGLNHLGTGFATLNKTLKHLCLTFNYCDNVTYKKGNPFTDAIQSLTGLTKLELNFRACDYVDIPVPLKGLAGLRHVKLDYAGGISTPFREIKELKSLGEGLKGAVYSLQYLHLNLTKSCNDEGLLQLLEGIKALSMLREFDLILESCRNVTDKSMPVLGETLDRLTGLKHLNLSLRHCMDISIKGFEFVSEAIYNISRNLHDAYLNIDSCDALTVDPIEYMKKRVKCSLTISHVRGYGY